MAAVTRNPFTRLFGAAALGGMWGSVLVGLTEAILITATSAPGGDYWLFPFAVVSYGLLGMGIGCGYGACAVVASTWRGQTGRVALGGAAAVALVIIGSAVARYHVVQRVFHEDLVTFSSTGIVVNLAVLLAVGVIALLARAAGRFLQKQSRGSVIAAAALVVCLAGSYGFATMASPRPPEAVVARHAAASAQGHPNVILIIADTLRADAVNGMSGRDTMPALATFAGEAVRFEHAYAQSSWTRPSIATIFTSLYPSQHGAIHKMDPLPDDVTTLAEALGASGYWTAGFVTNINVAPVFNFQQGFDEYDYLPPDFYFGATDSATRLAIYKGLRVVRERLLRDRIYFNNYYQDAGVVAAAVARWLDPRPPTPFFLLIHYMDPHDPYFEIPYNGKGLARVIDPNPAAARSAELHNLYKEDVRYLDGFLNGLFERLKSLGLYDSSIIVIAGDHGEEFQEHGGWWHGTSLYEEQVHVPLLIKRAREPKAGFSEARIARTIDIAPTILAAAGLTIPASFVGQDLFSPNSEPPVLFAEEDLEGNELTSLRIGPWKIITANRDNPRGLRPVELYNLDDDPGERNDRAGSEPERVQEMLKQLARQQSIITMRHLSELDHAADHRS